MNKNNEGKNHPKKKDVESTPQKNLVRKPLDILVKAGYRIVTGPYIPAKGDQN